MPATRPLVIPVEARLMNATASLLFAGVAVACLLTAVVWLARLPQFGLTRIEVRGDTTHNSAAGMRQQVLPRLGGNFFTIRLADVRSAFETLPWVRSAVVRRVFPNQLSVQLQEQREAAVWSSDGSGNRMLNEQGDIFDGGAVESTNDSLPELSGPDAAAPQVLAEWRALVPMVAPLGQTPTALALDARGNWLLTFEGGNAIELGAGSDADIAARLRQYLQTIAAVTARYGRTPADVQYADLRYKTGYAIRMRGVGTVDNTDDKAGAARPRKAKT